MTGGPRCRAAESQIAMKHSCEQFGELELPSTLFPLNKSIAATPVTVIVIPLRQKALMTEDEWQTSDDAYSMIEYIWSRKNIAVSTLPKFGGDMNCIYDSSVNLHRFYLACCRAIWPLLPQEPSRRGIELAEKWIAGEVSIEELNKFNWHVEAAAFNIDYNVEPEKIEQWVADLRSSDSHRHLLNPPETADHVDPRELLKRAAYFADYAMIYPSLRPPGPPSEKYGPFLSAELLRQLITFQQHY